MRRSAAVAGQFYQGVAQRLIHQVEQYIVKDIPKRDVIGIMVPHAGLIYSGAVAGAVYSSINFPKTFLMLGPNHTGLGPSVSIMDDGEWEIPTGVLTIDRRLASRIIQNTDKVTRDTRSHMFEHSLEVQLPFIIYFSNTVNIVPIVIMNATFHECQEIAEAIVKAIQSIDYPVVILASSDMSHYLSDKTTRKKDKLAIDRLLELDPSGLFDIVQKERISMCGYLPVTVMLIASKMLGSTNAYLVKYMTSGEVSGDYDAVVGYAGMIFTK